jgi:Protein of unknown function (DUF3987)
MRSAPRRSRSVIGAACDSRLFEGVDEAVENRERADREIASLFNGTPRTIESLTISTPAMPLALVPDALRPFAQDVAERMNVPLEMVAVPLIVAAAALVSRSLAIRPKRYDDWTIVPNLWGVLIGRPAMLKSPALSAALAPFRNVERKLRKNFDIERLTREADVRIAEAEIKKLEKLVQSADSDVDLIRAELSKKLATLAALAVGEPRRSTNDPTVEKLGELLRDHGPLLLVRDELVGWLKSLDKPGREGDRPFYLEAWNGDAPYTVDRIARGTVHIPRHCLSVIGTATPGPMRTYVGAATCEGAGADGLLQRLQLLVCLDQLPLFANVDRIPNEAARSGAYDVFQFLNALDCASIDIVEGNAGVPYLHFDDGGQRVFDAWREILEKRLIFEFDGEPALEAHVAKNRSLMPSLALTFHTVDCAIGGVLVPRIGEQAACLAADWCDFLETHARKVYTQDGVLQAARTIAERIKKGDVASGDSVRELYRKGWSGFSSHRRVMAALLVLQEANWLIVEPGGKETGPGRPSPYIVLHPSLELEREAPAE